jgi:hypothetical protein
MDLEFKHWLEDCGQVTSTYSNVNDEAFEKKGLRSSFTGGRRTPEKATSDPEKLFKFKKNKK